MRIKEKFLKIRKLLLGLRPFEASGHAWESQGGYCTFEWPKNPETNLYVHMRTSKTGVVTSIRVIYSAEGIRREIEFVGNVDTENTYALQHVHTPEVARLAMTAYNSCIGDGKRNLDLSFIVDKIPDRCSECDLPENDCECGGGWPFP